MTNSIHITIKDDTDDPWQDERDDGEAQQAMRTTIVMGTEHDTKALMVMMASISVLVVATDVSAFFSARGCKRWLCSRFFG